MNERVRDRRPLGVRLAGHSLTYGFAGVAGKVAALITVPYFTRELSAEGYGLADLALSFAAVITIIVGFAGDIPAGRLSGVATSATQRRRVLGSYVLATAGVSLACAIALVPLSDLIASVLWASPGSADLSIAALVLVPVSAVQASLVLVQRLEQRPTAFAVLALVDLVAQMAFAVAFVALGLGPLGLVLGLLAGSVVGMLAALWATRPLIALSRDVALMGRLLIMGMHFLPATMAFLFADGAARVIVANSRGIEDVGHLAVAFRIASVMSLAASAASLSWGPYALALEPSPHTARAFRRALRAIGLLIGFASLAVGALSPEVIRLLAGEEYAPAATAVPGLLVAAGLGAIIYVLVTAAGIGLRGPAVAVTSVLGAGAQIIATVFLLPGFGLAGVGAAAVLGRLVTIALLAPSVSGVIAGAGQVAIVTALAGGAAVVLSAMLDAGVSAGPRFLLGAVAVAGGILTLRRVLYRTTRPRQETPCSQG